jgi:hypothetical protein
MRNIAAKVLNSRLIRGVARRAARRAAPSAVGGVVVGASMPALSMPRARQEMLQVKLRRGGPDMLSGTDGRALDMRALLLLPALALSLLGAHFYRASARPLVLACVVLVVLLARPRAWVERLVQWALMLGAAEWLWTAFLLWQQRLALGQPWLRMSLILGAVAVFTAAAALVFRHAGLRSRFALR